MTVFGDSCAWRPGACGTTEYVAYVSAKTRCQNPKNPQWKYYAPAESSFGFPPSRYSGITWAAVLKLYRSADIDFEIGNVHWTTRQESAKNRKVYRKATYRKVSRTTTCGHPKHHAKGLCRLCYEGTPKVRARRPTYAAARYATTPRKITARINSWPYLDRQHYAFGLCVACYRVSPQGHAVKRRHEISPKRKTDLRALRRRKPAEPHAPKCLLRRGVGPRPGSRVDQHLWGHLDRPHKSNGRCQSCYDAFRRPRKPHRLCYRCTVDPESRRLGMRTKPKIHVLRSSPSPLAPTAEEDPRS